MKQAWETVGTCWANIKPVRGQEFFLAQQAGSDVTHRVILRDNVRVNPRQRLVTVRTGRVMNIVSVLHKETEDIFLELMCKEVPAADDARLLRG
jgi:SPP1 family predicted phage head-tail adaptor